MTRHCPKIGIDSLETPGSRCLIFVWPSHAVVLMRQDGWIEVTRRWLTVLSMQKSAFTGDPTAACGQRMSEFVTVETSSCTNCNHCHYAAFAIAETTDKVRWGGWNVNGTKFKISILRLLQILLHLNEIPHKLSTTELAQKSGGRQVPLPSTLTER